MPTNAKRLILINVVLNLASKYTFCFEVEIYNETIKEFQVNYHQPRRQWTNVSEVVLDSLFVLVYIYCSSCPI